MKHPKNQPGSQVTGGDWRSKRTLRHTDFNPSFFGGSILRASQHLYSCHLFPPKSPSQKPFFSIIESSRFAELLEISCQNFTKFYLEIFKEQTYPIPARKVIWQWKITIFNRRYIFKWLVFHHHVSNFQGCNSPTKCQTY